MLLNKKNLIIFNLIFLGLGACADNQPINKRYLSDSNSETGAQTTQSSSKSFVADQSAANTAIFSKIAELPVIEKDTAPQNISSLPKANSDLEVSESEFAPATTNIVAKEDSLGIVDLSANSFSSPHFQTSHASGARCLVKTNLSGAGCFANQRGTWTDISSNYTRSHSRNCHLTALRTFWNECNASPNSFMDYVNVEYRGNNNGTTRTVSEQFRAHHRCYLQVLYGKFNEGNSAPTGFTQGRIWHETWGQANYTYTDRQFSALCAKRAKDYLNWIFNDKDRCKRYTKSDNPGCNSESSRRLQKQLATVISQANIIGYNVTGIALDDEYRIQP